MPVDIKVNLKHTKNLLKNVRWSFGDIAPDRAKFAILKSILRGISPVQGEKFQQYSKGYKEQIRGEATYFTKGGKVFRIPANKGEKIDTVPRKEGKRISPRNLKLTGGLLRSIFASVTKFKPLVITLGFKHKLADIHNRRGAGRSKVVRRMLPREGEKFKKHIRDAIHNSLVDAVKKVVNKIRA